jgi:hypothetical protein
MKNGETLFTDLNSEYRLLDYNISHRQLLIRSLRNRERPYNIDIIFKGVKYLIVSDSFNGIEITNTLNLSETQFHFISKHIRNEDLYNNFILKTMDGKKYFINAITFNVFKNKLDILESSIGRYDEGNLNEVVK